MRALFALFFAFLLAFEFARGFESARSTSESKAKLHRKSRVEKSQQKHAAKAESSNIRSVSTTYNLQYSVGNDEVFLPKGSFKLDHTRNARSAKESLKVMLMEDVKPKFTLENLRRNDIYRIRAFPENEDPESGFLTYIRIVRASFIVLAQLNC